MLQLTLFVSFVAFSQAANKRWIPNTNLDNPENWVGGRVPCPNDKIHLPAKESPLYLQGNISTTELVLPINGELVLSDYMSISFPTQRTNDLKCPGEVATFNRTDPMSWLNPRNWCETSSLGGKCLAKQPRRLDTERVPCVNDAVVFPERSSFLVKIDSGVDIKMKSLTVAGKSHSSSSFHNFLMSKKGKDQFVYEEGGAESTFTIQERPCDKAGCVCGNDEQHIEEKICGIVKDDCEQTFCTKPLKPEGNCCYICGAILSMEYDSSFVFNNLYNDLLREYKREGVDNVDFIMTRTSSERILVVITDNSGGDGAFTVAIALSQLVKEDMKERGKFGITDLQIQSSTNDGASVEALTDSRSISSGGIVGIVIAFLVIIIVGVLCIFFFVVRRNRTPRFRFELFGQKKRDSDAVELTPSSSMKNVFFNSGGSIRGMLSGFDNPMYAAAHGDGSASVDNNHSQNKHLGSPDDNANVDGIEIEPTFVRGGVEDVGFSNPMYGTVLPSVVDDKSSPIMYDNSTVKFNPMFNEEGVEDDSTI